MNLEFNYFLFSYGTTITAIKRVVFKIFVVRNRHVKRNGDGQIVRAYDSNNSYSR